jgi:hypothetical protein
VLDWVSECENTTLALRLVADIGVFLAHTNHDTILLSVLLDKCLDLALPYP